MARVVLLAEPAHDEQYRSWLTENVRKYVAGRHTPYYIAFAFGNDDQDSTWHKIDGVTIVTDLIADVASKQGKWSCDLLHLMDTTQGDDLLLDVIMFVNELNGFQLDTSSFEALVKMMSWQPTVQFYVIVRQASSRTIPSFVTLLGATVFYGHNCLTTLTDVTPIWRGSLLLSNSNQDNVLLGGLSLDCHGNSDKVLNSDLVMEAIQVVTEIPLLWACPVEYKLSAGRNRPAAKLLQAINNLYMVVRFIHLSQVNTKIDKFDVGNMIGDCFMVIGQSCGCHGDIVSCNAWFLRKPDTFTPLPVMLLHHMSHMRKAAPPTSAGRITDVQNGYLEGYHRQLLASCHELDCDQNDWLEVKLLKNKELTMSDQLTPSLVVPTPGNILDETNQVLGQFKQDGSCDHTSELSPLTLVPDEVQYNSICSEGEQKLTQMDFLEACDGCYHGVSYCVNSAESQDSKLVTVQQKCVSRETQCSHDYKGNVAPCGSSHGNQISHNKSKVDQAVSKDQKKRSIRHKKRLQVIVMGALKERGVSRHHKCFTSCYKRLFSLSKSFLKDLTTSKNLTQEMKKVAISNAQQVIEFECRRTGISAPSQSQA